MSARISLRTLIWIGPRPKPKRRRQRRAPAEPTGPLCLPGLTAADFARREAAAQAEEEEYRRLMRPRPREARTKKQRFTTEDTESTEKKEGAA